MKADGDILITLAVQFAMMSLLAFGGANAVVPEMHRQAVELRGWMTEREFTDMFAMSQAAPGPNVMLVTLIGYHVAGVAGALGVVSVAGRGVALPGIRHPAFRAAGGCPNSG